MTWEATQKREEIYRAVFQFILLCLLATTVALCTGVLETNMTGAALYGADILEVHPERASKLYEASEDKVEDFTCRKAAEYIRAHANKDFLRTHDLKYENNTSVLRAILWGAKNCQDASFRAAERKRTSAGSPAPSSDESSPANKPTHPKSL